MLYLNHVEAQLLLDAGDPLVGLVGVRLNGYLLSDEHRPSGSRPRWPFDMNFVAGSGDPPSYTSLGDREQAGTIEFDFMGEQSEFSARSAIPMLAARQAMRYFLERETMSPDLDWECD